MALLFGSVLPGSPLLLTIALIPVLFGIYRLIIYPTFVSPLASIPAARWHARILPFYSYYIKYANIENREIYKLHKKHGSVVLLGPNELSVNCREGVKTIYDGNFPKPEWYFNRFSNFRTDNIFTTQDSKEHGQRKRLLSHIYSKSTILSSTSIVKTSCDIIFDHLFPILYQSSNSKTPVNIHPLDYAYSIDSFTAFQLGAKLGTNFVQDSTTRDWFLHHFFAPRPYTVFWEVEVPKFTNRLLGLGIRLVPKWCDQSRVAMEDFFLKKYDRAAQILTDNNNNHPSDDSYDWPAIFAVAKDKYGRLGHSSFMTTTTDPHPSAINPKPQPQAYPHRLQIASDMFDETVAAIETSGDALTFLHCELARNPAIQSALRAELRPLLPPTLPPHQALTHISLKSLTAQPLLDAVITETLRLYAPVGGPQPRLTPGPGVSTIAGYEGIPAGMRVHASAYCLHRNEEVFERAWEWLPYRWIDATEERLAEMRKWFWAFGSGGRMCIGQHFAGVSIKLAVAAIYLNFETELAGGEGVILEQEDGFTSGPKGDELWVRFKEI